MTTAKTEFPPTAEQETARELFKTGDSIAIEAGAGAGKTSTLILCANEADGRNGQYIAFNKAIVVEAGEKMPAHVPANTAHSLAFRAVGKRYAHRLRTSQRMRSTDIAKRLGITNLWIETQDQQRKNLSEGYLAGITMRAVGRFCQSADPEPTEEHVPYIDGIDIPPGRMENNRIVRRHIIGAVRKAWEDIKDEHGSLPFKHDHYLKLWQLSGPRIGADFILFDECQPPDTLVALAGGGEKRIAEIEVGDRVVSYTKGRILSERFGSLALGKSVRHYSGQLVTVAAGDSQSSYTPNHICMAVINPALEDRHMLYLMRCGNRYRVGVTKARHGTGPGRSTRIMGRLREERGEAAWILGAFDTRAEAEAAEELASLTWRIPQVRFGVEVFWSQWDTTLADVEGCVGHFGRDLRYPLVNTERRYMLGERYTEIRASNLMDGMLVRGRDGELRTISVARTPYDGPVVSLAVSGPKTYVADGIVTHNCQDANPVMVAIVAAQTHAQLVWVGDSQQQIYSFTGAVNALAKVPAQRRALLTQSFRFGPAIADVANDLLERLDADLRLSGTDTIDSRVEEVAQPDCILTRTNATAVQAVLNAQADGRKPHLVGGGREIVSFAEAARDLMNGKRTMHPELACFDDWGEVRNYVEQDEQGSELRLNVKLVDDFGVETILAALKYMPREEQADLIVSTAHKAKGREWDSVKLAADFPETAEGEELRLLYVAVTRARKRLDITNVVCLQPEEPEEEEPQPEVATSDRIPRSAEQRDAENREIVTSFLDQAIDGVKAATGMDEAAAVRALADAFEVQRAGVELEEQDTTDILGPKVTADATPATRRTVEQHLLGVEGSFVIQRDGRFAGTESNSRKAIERASQLYTRGGQRVTVIDAATGELVVEYDA